MDFVSGAIGGGIAEAAVMPLCTIMTFAATNPKDQLNLKTTLKRFQDKQPQHKITIQSWFPSARWQIGAQMFSTATKFGFYQQFKTAFPDQPIFINGTLGTLCAVTITHPIDTIKINRQLFEKKHYSKKELYEGFMPALAKGLVGGVTFFPIRDYFLEKQKTKEWVANTASALISTTAIHGFDMAKRRSQAQHASLGVSNLLKYFQGPGLLFNYVRVLLHFNIQMAVISRLDPFFKKF